MKKSKSDVEKLKTDILDTAEKLFLLKNYSEVNVRDITEQLGITRTPCYYHFSSKYEIYAQVVDRYLEKKLELFRQIHESEDPFFDKVRRDLELCTNQVIMETALFSEISTNPDLASIQQKRRETSDQIYELKRRAVEKGKKNGELRKDVNADEVVEDLYLIHFGLTEMAHCSYRTFSADTISRLITQQIIHLKMQYGNEKK